jgi:hypothetical protein
MIINLVCIEKSGLMIARLFGFYPRSPKYPYSVLHMQYSASSLFPRYWFLARNYIHPKYTPKQAKKMKDPIMNVWLITIVAMKRPMLQIPPSKAPLPSGQLVLAPMLS